jgi:hypothetical protein
MKQEALKHFPAVSKTSLQFCINSEKAMFRPSPLGYHYVQLRNQKKLQCLHACFLYTVGILRYIK